VSRPGLRILPALAGLALLAAALAGDAGTIDVGGRRQLLLDAAMLERAERVAFRVQRPEPREVALACDRPWERKVMHYPSVVFDQGRYRMWYRVDDGDPRIDSESDRTWTCYAESRDGVR
jgi:hypothetical protein